MANKTIKGLTVEIGGDTTKLGKALENVNKKSRDLSSELGQINRLLKMDPGNADLIVQKQKVLADAVANTADELETLKDAEKQVQEQFKKGEASEEQVRALQREIIKAEQKLEGYERAAKETADSLDRLGKEADDAGGEVDDFGKETDDAEDSARDLGNELDGGLSAGFTTIIGLATAAAGAIVGCVEASQQYRQEMGKLDTAFETNGFTAATAKNTYKELQSVLGETDQAVEAANHLAMMVDSETELNAMTHALTGVYATFGASLPIEALAESANETARTGEIAGNLADALNWAAEEGETFGVAMRESTEANEEWNESVEEAQTAEDFFNLALQECSDEQERQKLIVDTLTKYYGKAADKFKTTNKRVIEANKANEEWNETVAEIGDEMAPVMTEIKKFGASLLKDAKEPLKSIGQFITGTLLPALGGIIKWVQGNMPLIKSGIVGLTTAMVAYKAVVLATEIAHKGIKGALLATEAAQKLLNIAQAASPWGLAAVAIAGVVAGLIAWTQASDETIRSTSNLTEEEWELIDAAHETAKALMEQKAAVDENEQKILSQMGNVQSLAAELDKYVDANGRVQESDQARVDFILGQLNEALGTEYQQVDGVIQKYDELQGSIEETIKAKTANALLEANNEAYVAAVQAESELMEALSLQYKDYTQQMEYKKQAEEEYEWYHQQYLNHLAGMDSVYSDFSESEIDRHLDSLEGKVLEESRLLVDREMAYNIALGAYKQNHDTIIDYTEAQTLALEGHYDDATRLLAGEVKAFHETADGVDEAMVHQLDSLYKAAIDAGLAAKKEKENFEKGLAGFTEESVKEAEQGYEDAMAAYENAYNDAYGVGESLGAGLVDGTAAKKANVASKIREVIANAIAAAKDEAAINSPSKKMIPIGEGLGEGAEVGVESATKDVEKAARRQISSVIDTYEDESERSAPAVYRSLQTTDARRAVQAEQAAVANTSGMLGQILDAIKAGQVIALDGDKVVGGTQNRMNKALGADRALVARGAK